MGTVYAATHLGTGRAVALKVLVPELVASERAVERFQLEARVAGQLQHRNVVDVTDFGFAERNRQRLAYIVMELLRGKTLRGVLEEQGKLPLQTATDVLEQVCAAVAEAHRHGVLHRDLKPENIHLEPVGRGFHVRVLDFGIAKLVDAAPAPAVVRAPASLPEVDPATAATVTAVGLENAVTITSGASGSLTRPGAAVGTPMYMSPEQWQGRPVDARADVYSLGVVAYEMLCGEPPFMGKTRPISEEHVGLAPPRLAERAPDLPVAVVAVVEAALAKAPAHRPASVEAFAAGLRQGTETTGGLLRRSIGLCLDNYRVLARRYAIVTMPAVVMSALAALSSLLARVGVVSRLTDTIVLLTTLAVVALFGLLAGLPLGGLAVPLVADLMALRPPSPHPPWGVVWRVVLRALPSSLATQAILFFAMLPFGLAIVPVQLLVAPGALRTTLTVGSIGATALAYLATFTPLSLVGPVVAIEGAGGIAPLKRSWSLVRPVWRIAARVSMFYGIFGLAAYGLASVLFQSLLRSVPALASAISGVKVDMLVSWTWTALIAPFSLVPFSMLYLRARQAEGAPLPTPGATIGTDSTSRPPSRV